MLQDTSIVALTYSIWFTEPEEVPTDCALPESELACTATGK